jgi:hypothetical protein
MKTIPKNKITPRSSTAVLSWLSLLSLALVAPLFADDAAPPKDHALFAGATVKVEDGPGFFDIAGVQGYTVSLQADGKFLHVRRDEVRNVLIGMNLKLTDVIARIDKLVVTPIFVGSRDDRFADMHMQMLMSDLAADSTDNMSATTVGVEVKAAQQAAAAYSSALPPPPVDYGPIAAASAKDVSMQSSSDSFAFGAGADNSLNIACELSAPRVMHNTYVLVLTEFRQKSGGKSTNNVDIEPVGELGPKPRKVTLTQTGFPPDFVLGHVSLHLYSGSLELATNLSEGRVDLTADDAIRYLVLAYVASHAKDSLPATPLVIALPADFKQRAPVADLNRTFYVTVGEDGRVQGLSAESGHRVAVDPYIDLSVRKFRYEPALKEGKPVATVVEMRLDSFLR